MTLISIVEEVFLIEAVNGALLVVGSALEEVVFVQLCGRLRPTSEVFRFERRRRVVARLQIQRFGRAAQISTVFSGKAARPFAPLSP